MSRGKWLMFGGAGSAVLGGIFLWRGWVRYKECMESAWGTAPSCKAMNAPLTAGAILAPLGVATFFTGAAVALIEGKGA